MNRFLVIALVLIIILVGCGSRSGEEAQLESKIFSLQEEITALEEQKAALESEVAQQKIENGTAKYVVTFLVKQSHFTLKLKEHLKDSLNELTVEVPVDKEFYDSVEVNDVITEDFRFGSLIMRGSFGNWKIIIDKKEIR